jgi:uncharacterized membrane protein YfcA
MSVIKKSATLAVVGALLAACASIIALNNGAFATHPLQPGSAGWFVILGAAFLTGYIDTCVGGGHGTLLTPVLIMLGFPAKMVVPAILLSEICIGLLATVLNHRAGNLHLAHDSLHWKVLMVLAGCSLVGSILAVTAAVRLPAQWIDLYIGLVVVGVGILMLTGRKLSRTFSMKRIVLVGAVAAFNKGISGGGYGPLLTSGQVLSGVSEKGAVSITPPARGLTGAISVALYFFSKGTLEPNLALPLIIGSLLAMPVAVATVTVIEPTMLRKGIVLSTLLLGAFLVVRVFIR